MSNSTNNHRIAKNSLILYVRMLFTMFITFYTSRIVLKGLGIEDYGIYNVVGGFVSMFGFLNAAMVSSTQRYLNFELGKGNLKRLHEVFVTSVNIHLLISLIVLILGETVGLWFVLNKLQIPENRMIAAQWVYQCSIITTIIAIMSFPYTALIIAHEKMSAFAYISILDVLLKLGIAFFITFLTTDRLIFYSILILLVHLSIIFIYNRYCIIHYNEAHYYFYKNKSLIKEMSSFAGWNLWGNCASILYTQGLNVLLNMFFGPVVNAARGIAVQVESAIVSLSTNFQMAVNPQITKSYATGDLKYMHSLVFRSSKFTFLLLYCIALPILIECPFILKIWLVTVPDNSVIFLRIMLCTMLVDATARPFMTAATATGKVRLYQSVVGGVLLIILPISYIVLKMGGEPWSVFIVHLCICIIAFWIRLFIIRPLIFLSIRKYVIQVIFPCLKVISLSLPVALFAKFSTHSSTLTSIILIVCCILLASVTTISCGITTNERSFVLKKISLVYKH